MRLALGNQGDQMCAQNVRMSADLTAVRKYHKLTVSQGRVWEILCQGEIFYC